MKANKDNIKEGDTLIFLCDEWRDGKLLEFDGTVQAVHEDGVEMLYLSGYRSRDDFIPYKDVIAKVDKSKPWVKLKDVAFSGHFEVFEEKE